MMSQDSYLCDTNVREPRWAIARRVKKGVTLGVHKGAETGLGHTQWPQVTGEDPFLDLSGEYKVVCLIILMKLYLCFVCLLHLWFIFW